jgi:xanthine dehydrogenase accessory factor
VSNGMQTLEAATSTNSSGLDVERVRADFPIFRQQMRGKPLVYLDSGASAQKPQVVIDAITDFYANHYSSVHRGVYQLSDVATRLPTGGRLVDLSVSDIEALASGLSCGGSARCLMVPASELPAGLWPMLLERDPICLVTDLDGDQVQDTELFTTESIDDAGEDVAARFRRGASETAIVDDRVVTILWPVPKVVIVGGGAIADALEQAATLLGWHTQTVADTGTATGLVAGLAPLDKLVVMSHDLEVAGPVLAAALDSAVGYIGALGSRRTQQARAEWLAYRGLTDLERINGPAGLDIGANSPAEIAVSILAEALATASSATGTSLNTKPD